MGSIGAVSPSHGRKDSDRNLFEWEEGIEATNHKGGFHP